MGKTVMLAVMLVCVNAPSAIPALSDRVRSDDVDARPYDALIRRCAQHESENLPAARPFEFRERLEWLWGSETRAVIETAEGRADRIVAFNDQPLADDQQAKQRQRLLKLLNNSKALQSELAEQREEVQRRRKMIRSLPDAFLMEFSGAEPDGRLRFSFQPNPSFVPHDRETQVYKGMRGSLWIDPRAERLLRVEGELFKDVSFGWGILGRLHKGGRYQVAQTEVSPGLWRITTLNLDLKGRVLLFGSLRILRRESNSSFTITPPELSYHDALLRLLNNPPYVTLPGERGHGSLPADQAE
jgi:hypothetical protein